MNRVEEWCEYLADELNSVGYNIDITAKTDWTSEDMRTASAMERVRSNIKKITQGFYYITNVNPSAEAFNWQKANNWEKVLNEINTLMKGMEAYYVHSGVASAGSNRLFQNRFRRYKG